jgi:hypothetical protein
MASADEVPPHDYVLSEGLSAEHDQAAALLAAEADVVAVDAEIKQLVDSDCRRFHDNGTRDDQDSVLEALLDSEYDFGAGIKSQICPAER